VHFLLVIIDRAAGARRDTEEVGLLSDASPSVAGLASAAAALLLGAVVVAGVAFCTLIFAAIVEAALGIAIVPGCRRAASE
jgi:hypothetical protein